MPKPLEIIIQTEHDLEIFYEDDTDYSDVYYIILDALVRNNVADIMTNAKNNLQYL